MSRRDAGTAGQRARHVRARLQATLGETPGLLEAGLGPDGFEYRGAGNAGGPERGAQDGSGRSPSLRWRVGLRVALLLAAVAVVAGAWFWWQAASATPEVLPLVGSSSGASTGASTGVPANGKAAGPSPDSAAGQGGAAPAAPVVVHVAGAVGKPGVIRLQQGGRVDDAIAAAGGPTPDADVNRLNLALVVEDGQKIYVPQQGEPVSSAPDAAGSATSGAGGPGTGGSAPGAAGGKINLNTAGATELDTLPKVGPVLAQRIVDWRKEHGPFKSVEELDAVDGVGPKMLESLLPLVTV